MSECIGTQQTILLSRRGGEGGDFYEDVERILYSNAYVRYGDKTQVVYLLPHDHITYRGLHVQLVSALARSIGKQIGLSLDLIEAISLGHDLGHPPFGHDGEGYLHEISTEFGIGGFSHARQSCRVAEEIEPLHLTLATLDGFLCHDGGMKTRMALIQPQKTWEQHDEELETRRREPEIDLLPATFEAAVVKIADTASYLERDLTDAITLGLITPEEIPGCLFQKGEQSLTKAVAANVVETYRATHTVGLSLPLFQVLTQIRRFSCEHIYVNPQLKQETKKISSAYRLLCEHLVKDATALEKGSLLWRHFLHNKQTSYIEKYTTPQHVVDYVAGMTDGYFLRLFQEIFVPRTITVPNVLPFS